MRLPSAILLAALLALSAGCRRNTASSQPVSTTPSHPVTEQSQQRYAAALAEDTVQRPLPPSELVALHQEKGVGLSLQITGRRFQAGRDIPLLIAYEDLAAAQPVSSSNCNGFAIAVEDVDHGKNVAASLSPCSAANPFAQSNVPLVRGNLRFLHASLAAGRIVLIQPGRYLINASWQSYRPANGPFRKDDTYAPVRSNVIPIMIAP